MQGLLNISTQHLTAKAERTGVRLAILAVALFLADSFIHALVVPEHFEEWWGYGVFFLVLAFLQVIYGVNLFRWASRPRYLSAGILGTLWVLAFYVITRTLGIPIFGPHAGHTEGIGTLDLLSKLVEGGALLVLWGLWAQTRRREERNEHEAKQTTLTSRARRDLLNRAPVKLALGATLVLALLLVGYRFGTGLDLGKQGTVSASDAESCARRGCDAHFTATLLTQRYAEKLGIWDTVQIRQRTAQPFLITATSHAGTVRDLSLDGKVFLRAGEYLYPASGKPLGITTHHNTYLVFFPRYDMHGQPLFEQETGQFQVVVNDLDEVISQRTMTFNYPVPATNVTSFPAAQVLMVVGAAMAALLFACTPCLVGSMAVGSFATGATTAVNRAEGLSKRRRALVRQAVIYLSALSVTYMGIVAAVTLLKLQVEDLRPVELAGGVVLLGIGLYLFRSTTPGLVLEGSVRRVLGKAVSGLHRSGQTGASQEALGQGASSAMGASLAMVCSVAGAPTLSTSILLPLLVYAGLNHPLWALLILAVYLAVSSIPFLLIAVGWGELVVSASIRLQRTLVAVSAALMVALGLLLVVSPSTVAGLISTPARLALLPLRWLY